MTAEHRSDLARRSGTTDRRLRAWAYLSRVVEGPCAQLVSLIARSGPEETALFIRRNGQDLDDRLRRRARARRGRDVVSEDLRILDRLGGRLVTPDSPEWPQSRMTEFGLDEDVPDGSPPVALWTLGALELTRLGEQAAAIVGTRAASGYGEHVTAEIAAELADRGFVVVSGAAYGVDGAAHRAALGVGGETAAVLACGLDRAYPAGHVRLLREIAARGVVFTEYPPGVVPGRHRFLARNRLVAGMADATVVVEAGHRSGAINTAGWAERLDRRLLAVPGPVTSATSAGCHRLIRDSRAHIATGAADVVEVAGKFDASADSPGAHEAGPGKPTDGLTLLQLAVHDGLPSSGSASCERVAVEAGMPVSEVMSALAVLELRGLAVRADVGWSRVAS